VKFILIQKIFFSGEGKSPLPKWMGPCIRPWGLVIHRCRSPVSNTGKLRSTALEDANFVRQEHYKSSAIIPTSECWYKLYYR